MSDDEPRAIYLTRARFEALPEYSCSIPTGQTIGKAWRRGVPFRGPRRRWYMGRYVEHPDPDLVGIEWRLIRIVDLESSVSEDAPP